MNLILQHWAGEIPELVGASVANITAYAQRLGADYRLLRGFLFHEALTAPCQKLHMLSDEFDEYDVVVMVDADMFVPRGMSENVFELKGIGWCHADARARVRRLDPTMISSSAPFWGGAIYRLERDVRQRLRGRVTLDEMLARNARKYGEDEGIMHLSAARAGMTEDGAYIDFRWCQSSFLPNPEAAAMIHIRTTTYGRPGYPADGRTKTQNYHHLRDRGVIE